jgi:hypothetical protein
MLAALGLVEVGSGEQDRQTVPLQAAQDPPEVAARHRIDAGRRLVHHQQLGGVDQGAGQRQLLLHAAGEAVRETAAERRQAQAVQQLVAPRPPVVDAVDGGEEGDVLVDREIAVEREALGQVADPAAELGASPDGVDAAGAHRPAVRRQQSEDDAQGGRLAGAVRADQAEHLAALDAEADVVDRHQVAIAPDEPLDRHHLRAAGVAGRLVALGSGGAHHAPPDVAGPGTGPQLVAGAVTAAPLPPKVLLAGRL